MFEHPDNTPLPGGPKRSSRLTSAALALVVATLTLTAAFTTGPDRVRSVAFRARHAVVSRVGRLRRHLTNEMEDAPVTDDSGVYAYINNRALAHMHQVVLVLFDSTVEEHVQLMAAIQEANLRHDINFVKHDCHRAASACSTVGHAEVATYEPPLMFYHYGQWSESFHDEIQVGNRTFGERVGEEHRWIVPRHERVAAVLEWASEAAKRADQKIVEREQRLAQMSYGFAEQLYQAQMAAKEAADKAAEGAKAEL